jgi:hypothetical protein
MRLNRKREKDNAKSYPHDKIQKDKVKRMKFEQHSSSYIAAPLDRS